MSRDLGGDDFEVDQQTLFVIDDFGLAGSDAEIAGGACAAVFDHDSQREGNGRLDDVSVRIIREHIALVEVFHEQARVRENGDSVGKQRHGQHFSSRGVTQRAFDEVDGRLGRCRILIRDECPLPRARAFRGNAVAGDTFDDRWGNAEERSGIGSGGVHDPDIDLQAFDGVSCVVVQDEGGVEGVAGHHGFLFDLQFHLGTDTAALGGRDKHIVGGIMEGIDRIVVALRTRGIEGGLHGEYGRIERRIGEEIRVFSSGNLAHLIDATFVEIDGAVQAVAVFIDELRISRSEGGRQQGGAFGGGDFTCGAGIARDGQLGENPERGDLRIVKQDTPCLVPEERDMKILHRQNAATVALKAIKGFQVTEARASALVQALHHINEAIDGVSEESGAPEDSLAHIDGIARIGGGHGVDAPEAGDGNEADGAIKQGTNNARITGNAAAAGNGGTSSTARATAATAATSCAAAGAAATEADGRAAADALVSAGEGELTTTTRAAASRAGRRRDVADGHRHCDAALGGQGAPLVPIFDYYFLRDEKKDIVALNIGGIANITIIPKNCSSQNLIGFDTGPGNMLIDIAVSKYFNKKFDENGEIAKSGQLIEKLYKDLLRIDFIYQVPPKSTGREFFNYQLLNSMVNEDYLPNDVIRTITQFSAFSIAHNIKKYAPINSMIVVSGGGRMNSYLIDLLNTELIDYDLMKIDELNINGDAKEAICFAFLGYLYKMHLHGNINSISGATKEIILGVSANNI